MQFRANVKLGSGCEIEDDGGQRVGRFTGVPLAYDE